MDASGLDHHDILEVLLQQRHREGQYRFDDSLFASLITSPMADPLQPAHPPPVV